ncbi:peptide/nickel transport system substrate-binding protein [Desulfotomaculum arcticum]|uniref:Peptide/nickel transport system substrate-binding protein n=1 Tax=Desulfotruncus arcticus DSM 17038 TaxID=1121424 RepID=A0A1I2TKK5_9FIRM|nr:ABC transporter substrate-binding protein [Desulfotruncus arcticus]SFG65343.1 peptide/nickel transport system substrate-binding protein [Desulfotomaculum arcticum] [Desulfotruncus arcticus DSM 17038]
MKRRVFLFCSLMVLALSLLVAGCGGSKEESNDGGATGAQKSENVLVWGRGGDSPVLDPAIATDGEAAKVTINVFDTLVEYKPENTEVRPALAKEWSVSEDGLVWTFKLRDDVKFHDGTPFNADAVVYNFNRWMKKDNPLNNGECKYWMYMFNGYDEDSIVKSCEKTGDYEVKITLREPSAPFIQNIAMFSFGIASPTALEKYGNDFFKNPVGTGPFKFVEWVPDDRIVLEKNNEYWGEKAKVDKAVFRSIPDNAARFLELQAGTIDMMDGINPDDVAAAKSNENFQIILRPSMNIGYLSLNMEKEPFDNLKVRQAISHAINKQAIIDAFFAGLAKPAKNPMPPSLWGYNDDITDYEYDPAKAKALLAEAGFPDGFETTLWAMPVPRPYMQQPQKIAEAIQADLAAVGIKAEIVSYEWGQYLEKAENGEHDMVLLGWTGDNGDPDNFLYVLLDKDNAVKGSSSNYSFYKNDQVHDLFIKAQREMDQDKRADLYKQAQEIIHNDAPMVPLDHSTDPIVLMKYVKGYIPHPTGVEKINNVSVQ